MFLAVFAGRMVDDGSVSERSVVLAAQAERVLAEITRLQDALDAGDLVVTGSTGQPVPNKLLAECGRIAGCWRGC